jgi:hypothetical protein
MDLLEKFVPKKKKKTLVLTNVGKRVGGITYLPEKGDGGEGDYIPTDRFENFRTIKPSK